MNPLKSSENQFRIMVVDSKPKKLEVLLSIIMLYSILNALLVASICSTNFFEVLNC